MADEFDLFLSDALAPPDRDPDRSFVRRVQARIAVEDRLRAERTALLSGLLLKLCALAAFAGALLWLSRSPAVAELAAESPAILLAALLIAFSLLMVLLGTRSAGSRAPASPKLAFSIL